MSDGSYSYQRTNTKTVAIQSIGTFIMMMWKLFWRYHNENKTPNLLMEVDEDDKVVTVSESFFHWVTKEWNGVKRKKMENPYNLYSYER